MFTLQFFADLSSTIIPTYLRLTNRFIASHGPLHVQREKTPSTYIAVSSQRSFLWRKPNPRPEWIFMQRLLESKTVCRFTCKMCMKILSTFRGIVQKTPINKSVHFVCEWTTLVLLDLLFVSPGTTKDFSCFGVDEERARTWLRGCKKHQLKNTFI